MKLSKLKILVLSSVAYIVSVGFILAADQELPEIDNLESRQRYYRDGLTSIGQVEDMAGWTTTIGKLKNYCWHLEASNILSHSDGEWSTEVDTEKLKKIFEGMCGTVATIAAAAGGVGGINMIADVISEIVQCFISALKGEKEGPMVFTGAGTNKRAKTHGVVADKENYKYVAGYFLSFERITNEKTSPIHKSKGSSVKCAGRIDLFEIFPRGIASTIISAAPIDDLYDWLPPGGCTTNTYVAIMDNTFEFITAPAEGFGGWCQLVDTRDRNGNIIYSIRHYLRNVSGTSYHWSSVGRAQAEIEILIGSNYTALAQSKKIGGGEITTPEVHVVRRMSTYIHEEKHGNTVINRHKSWMSKALVGMEMPKALTCSDVIETIKSMIKSPIPLAKRRSQNSTCKPLEYCSYGSSFSSKAINCIPWPFMFWERVLGRRICNKDMGNYLDFNVWFSSCKIEQGFNAFFNDDDSLIESKMKLVQIPMGANTNRVWMQGGREGEGEVEYLGGSALAYSRYDWNKKLRNLKIEVMDIDYKDAGCFML